jgi:Tfp pilus assembly protein PilO
MRFDRQQIGIVVAVVTLTAIFAILQYRPLRSQAHAMQQVKAAQLSACEKTEAEIKNLPALRGQLKATLVKIGNYDAKIPRQRNLGAFLQEIADAMNKYNLDEQMVQPDNEIELDGIACIPVRIQCRGSLEQVFGFFRSLQTMERLIRIEQTQLKGDSTFSGMVTVVARGDIYYRTSGSQSRNP